MSTSDAITDLTQAAKRVEESLAVEEARSDGSMWKRMNLNAVLRDIKSAIATLRKCQP